MKLFPQENSYVFSPSRWDGPPDLAKPFSTETSPRFSLPAFGGQVTCVATALSYGDQEVEVRGSIGEGGVVRVVTRLPPSEVNC